jgi:ribosomal-protein-alanine N-acetyltransferase
MLPPVDDIDRIMGVMATAFDPAYGEAWSRRQVEDSLMIGNCHYLLFDAAVDAANGGSEIAGFCLSRSGYEEEELLLFAVDPAYRRKGVGAAMLAAFASEAQARNARRLLLEMRKGNAAESLYRRYGFRTIGQRINYYKAADGSRIDALTFAFEFD